MSPRQPAKPKPFSATKEVKRQAREGIGSPPPVRREEGRKQKPTKHKKKIWEEMIE